MTGVFCAIDAPDLESARVLVTRLSGIGVHIKLGLELFVAAGPQGISELRRIIDDEAKIFLDLKLHDIPNTVAGAIRSAVHCQPDFITVHASGGLAMMKAAAAAAREGAEAAGVERPKILGVTVLTNLDASDLDAVGQKAPLEEQVLRLATLAKASGLDGIICSPHEISTLRAALGADFLLVVPGIRPADAAAGDQKRTMTPAEAAKLGADYLVVGRPITQAPDPAEAARAILQSMI